LSEGGSREGKESQRLKGKSQKLTTGCPGVSGCGIHWLLVLKAAFGLPFVFLAVQIGVIGFYLFAGDIICIEV